MKKRTARRLGWAMFILVLIVIGSFWYASRTLAEARAINKSMTDLIAITSVDPWTSAHTHADFMMYLEGKEVLFTDQSLVLRNPYADLHAGDANTNLIHIYAKGVTVKQFFRTIGIDLTRNCATVLGTTYCNEPEKGRTLKYYVNGVISPDAPDVVIADQDKILISYGSDSYKGVQSQLATVGDRAASATSND